MTSKEKFFDLIAREKATLHKLGVERIGLSGSALRGDDTECSDYDVLVTFQKAK